MGEVFAGRYELIDMIGEGGMGAVWRVRDLKKDLVVAAKVLRQSDAGSLLRFMREQGMRIHHPNVVTPLGWAGEDDRVLFTMPLVGGGAVNNLMRDHGALPPRYAAEVMRQLLSALQAVHAAGVVHRDIKPANLLLDASGTDRPHLWLTDFGVALATDGPRLTSLSVVMGTPGYLAPEQLRGADPDPVADLYAAGMVGLELVTGARPRPQMRTDRADLPSRPGHVPPSLWDLLVRLADPDPRGRPASAAAALAALQVPELAWQPQDSVVVPSRLPELPGVAEGEFLRPGDEDDRRTADFGAAAGSTDAATAAMTGGPGATVAQPANGGATARVPAHGSSQGGPATVRQPAGHDAATAPGASARGRSKAPMLTLILAPLLAIAAIALLWLGPFGGSGSAEDGTGDVANRGGVCDYGDAGTTAQDAAGQWLRCTAGESGYTWQ
ncbi:protein kinase domain-containing protein [Dermacoccaceae bacterium W4C1]